MLRTINLVLLHQPTPIDLELRVLFADTKFYIIRSIALDLQSYQLCHGTLNFLPHSHVMGKVLYLHCRNWMQLIIKSSSVTSC
ncbi:hypothetical protein AQUCO_06500007v1 [Aquilegia coerulea]|uniref:Uncharacterized protein n=1 Tax=Aquilegia coerulea TaxID=218851 RepID=A0A2G5CC59_AQUCA|nr:hypothetical protein AQUCO_06500007v1 [Aquilegia coerulea]